jgi:hypothetical protein
MANIALDIKANTQKALGEFKKLSRELDNKFLVQGLKLDVVKNAFTQINREFENAVGTQGLKQAETTGQLTRNLGLRLAQFGRFGRDVSQVIAKDVVGSLQQLRAEGKITQEVFEDSVGLAAFLDFDATGPELQRKLKESSRYLAEFVQDSKSIIGGEQGQLISKFATGDISFDEFLQLSQGVGGASLDRIKEIARQVGGFNSEDAVIRTEALLETVRIFKEDPVFAQSRRIVRPLETLFIELGGLFSDTGVFGALREVGGKVKAFGLDEQVSRNLLNVTANLLRSIFDREEGVFAKLNKTLQDVFKGFDVLEPILAGATFLTEIFEKLGNFFESPEFRSFLSIFDKFVVGIKSIFNGGSLDLSAESINKLIDGIFEAIRGLINNIAKFIMGLDAGAIASVLGNIIGELSKTAFSLLQILLAGLGKGIQTIFSDGRLLTGVLATGGIASLLGIDKFLGGQGPFTSIQNSLNKALGRRGGRGLGGLFRPGRDSKGQFDKVTGERLTGFQSAVLRYMREIIRILDPGGSFLDQGADPNRRRRDTQRGTRRGGSPRMNPLRRLTGGLGRTAYTSPIGPLPLNSQAPYASVPGGGFTPRLESAVRPGRFTQAGDAVTRFARGGIGNPGNALNRGLIGTGDSAVASRFASRFGTRGILARGARRAAGGIAGAALGALLIGGIFSGGAAQAREIDADDRLSPEEKEFLKNKNRESTRQQAGAAAIGMAGGALGAGLGTLIGGPAGTFIGGAIGNTLGGIVADMLGPGVLEGVGKFVEDIGSFFGDLWNNVSGLAQGGFKNFMNFFGPEGPIQSLSRFVFELPGNIVDTIKEGFSSAYDGLKDLGGNIVNTLASLFGGGRFLGGVGSGLTLVGENGPELVNLGSGTIVIPNSSLNGNLYGGGGSSSPVNNYVTVNVNAPGADEFAQQLSDAVIIELNNQFEQLSTG